MSSLNSHQKRREDLRQSVRLPLDYWETLDVIQGGLVANISGRGLLIHSVHTIQIGAHLTIRVYLSKEYSLDQVEGRGQVVWMNLHQEQDWKGYKYGFYIVQMAPDDRQRLLKYFLKLQEEDSSSNREVSFKNYQDYIHALSHRNRAVTLTESGLRLFNGTLQWLKNQWEGVSFVTPC